jgi:AbrB family looped-hinge helix DNA binding protein
MDRQAHRTILRVADGGRIVIPAEVRSRLGMEVGAELVLTVEADHATLMNAKAARRKAREKVRRYVKPGVSLSKELMAQRKAEARRE